MTLYRSIVVTDSRRQAYDDRYFVNYFWAYENGWRKAYGLKEPHHVEVEESPTSWLGDPNVLYILPTQLDQPPVWRTVERRRSPIMATAIREGDRIEALIHDADGCLRHFEGTVEGVTTSWDGRRTVSTWTGVLSDYPHVEWFIVDPGPGQWSWSPRDPFDPAVSQAAH